LVDGVTPVQGLLQSPIFQPYNFVSGGHRLGPTQWIDAFQRATFWQDVSTRSRNYHVKLTPVVAPTQTMGIPYDDWWYLCEDETCTTYDNALDFISLKAQAKSIFTNLGLRPDEVPVFITGSAVLVDDAEGNYALGFTSLEPPETVQPGMGPFVWIATDYFARDFFVESLADSLGLGHELLHLVTN